MVSISVPFTTENSRETKKRPHINDNNLLKSAIQNQNVCTIHFKTLGIKVFCNVILSLLRVMIKHSQSNKSNKFPICLYLKKEVSNKVFNKNMITKILHA